MRKGICRFGLRMLAACTGGGRGEENKRAGVEEWRRGEEEDRQRRGGEGDGLLTRERILVWRQGANAGHVGLGAARRGSAWPALNLDESLKLCSWASGGLKLGSAQL